MNDSNKAGPDKLARTAYPLGVKAFVVWGCLHVGGLAYINYRGLRIANIFSPAVAQHSGAPGARLHHK